MSPRCACFFFYFFFFFPFFFISFCFFSFLFFSFLFISFLILLSSTFLYFPPLAQAPIQESKEQLSNWKLVHIVRAKRRKPITKAALVTICDHILNVFFRSNRVSIDGGRNEELVNALASNRPERVADTIWRNMGKYVTIRSVRPSRMKPGTFEQDHTDAQRPSGGSKRTARVAGAEVNQGSGERVSTKKRGKRSTEAQEEPTVIQTYKKRGRREAPMM
mmetsp:Transcript_42878/g.110599  ORF Transcript_42878/g.110599 Transcript_42878/m.110599 type:complete len:219 (-) Transcript_42878:116-772(-)